MWDVAIENNEPRLTDFVSIYHPLEMSPERTAEELPKTKALLEEFVLAMGTAEVALPPPPKGFDREPERKTQLTFGPHVTHIEILPLHAEMQND